MFIRICHHLEFACMSIGRLLFEALVETMMIPTKFLAQPLKRHCIKGISQHCQEF